MLTARDPSQRDKEEANIRKELDVILALTWKGHVLMLNTSCEFLG
jgi:hypothetical protein